MLTKFKSFFSFCPTLGPIYPMKEGEIEKNKKIFKLNSGIWLSKNRKIKVVSLLPFKWKIGLLFALFWAFWGKKGAGSRVSGSQSKFHLSISPPLFLGMFQSKKFCPSTCQFCGYWCQRSCFFDFQPLFQFWLLFQVPHPIT